MNTIAKLEIETLEQQLILFKATYEEMIMNEQEFEAIKPIMLQIKELEKAIKKLTSDKSTSIISGSN